MSNAQNTPTPYRKKFTGDKEAATYRWELYLDNGYIFDGYSKNIGQDEKHDKQALFQDCIARLLNSGYLDKTYQMLFFKREFMHKSQDTLLLEMYPDRFVMHNELQLDISTENFLKRIYMARATGAGLNYKQMLPQRASKRDNEKEIFAFSLQRFPTEDKLVEYCKELVKTYPHSRVEAWWKKFRVAYFNQPAPAPKPPVQYKPVPTGQASQASQQRQTPGMAYKSAPLDEDNQEAAERAQRALNNLVGKYQSNR